MKQLRASLIAVEDVTGALLNPDGLDPEDLLHHVSKHGGVAGYEKADPVDHNTFLSAHSDIFIPAALEDQITATTAPLLNTRLVAEAANGPTDSAGDQILRARKISVLPDILCNAGGVIVSYFEWLQNKRSEFWELEEVDGKLHKRVIAAYEKVYRTVGTLRTDWRTAAYVVALTRLEKVYKERGIFP
jgi:glutamate dehydrogenase (NAD(P)+)